MHQFSKIVRQWLIGILCTLVAMSWPLAPVHSATLSPLDSDPGLEQTEVSPKDLVEIEQQDEIETEEAQQDLDDIQSQIQDDLDALQAATSDATSAVSDLLEQSQRVTQVTARQTWDDFIDQLLKWKLQAQLRTRQHIESTRQLLDDVGQSLSQTLESYQEQFQEDLSSPQSIPESTEPGSVPEDPSNPMLG